MTETIEQWNYFELTLRGPRTGNPFVDIQLTAKFQNGRKSAVATGFYDGGGLYKIRFMPDKPGNWHFCTVSNHPSLDGLSGSYICIKPSGERHGPVRVKNRFHFSYEDGTPYFPFGTTCYAWIHQSDELQRQTLKTLKNSPFNKLRMCLFPKDYEYNHSEPALYPYEGSIAVGFDFERFRIPFFHHLERQILELRDLGIECDLILFHPYDRWGFSSMNEEHDDLYVKYVVSRLSAFSNIWWSLANEYDLMEIAIPQMNRVATKKVADWDRFAQIIRQTDPSRHLLSMHNCMKMFDHSKRWVTHCSIQRIDVYRTAENTDAWRKKYGKPVVIDECAYEGNLDLGWGNITGQEMVRRCWEGTLRGGYVGHGETYLHPKDILWWSHGGILHGTSPERIAFLRKIIAEAPAEINPDISISGDFPPNWDVTVGTAGEGYFLYYFGINQPAFRRFRMPEGKKYHVDIIDTWAMSINELPDTFEGNFKINLPAKQYIAVRLIEV